MNYFTQAWKKGLKRKSNEAGEGSWIVGCAFAYEGYNTEKQPKENDNKAGHRRDAV